MWSETRTVTQTVVAVCMMFGVEACQSPHASQGQAAAAPRSSSAVSSSKPQSNAEVNPALLAFSVAFWTQCSDCSDDQKSAGPLRRFDDAFERIRSSYVTSVDDQALIETAIGGMRNRPAGSSPEELIDGALKAMVGSLDPRSKYITASEMHEASMISKGNPITRLPTKNAVISTKLDNGIGYIRIARFTLETDAQLRSAISSLKAEASAKPKGYILDLRNNPGGLLLASVAVADDLLKKGDIASIQSRLPEDTQHFSAHGLNVTGAVPLVVLINKQTASGSEIVAGALQDNHRATLVGVRSNGTGSIQTIIPLQEDTGIVLTTAYVLTPAGRFIQGTGIEPDIAVPWADAQDFENQKSPLGDVSRDVQYARAVQFLRNLPSE
jgi:C-terminal processing protease CtpA/Prc